MLFSLAFENEALKALKKINKRDRERIYVALELLRSDPTPSKSRKLVEYPYRRVKVGNYRIVYRIENDKLLIIVIRAGHRSVVYRDMPRV